MKYDRKMRLLDAMEILINLIRCIHLKNALHELEPNPKLNFWRIMYGVLMDISVLEWCKLFGSDDMQHQPTHWKNVVPKGAHVDFRKKLLKKLNVSPSQWKIYWQEMKTFRDWHVAHYDKNRRKITNYPVLGLALESSYFYFEYVRSEMVNYNVRYRKDIKKYGTMFSKQAKNIGRIALSATSDIKETAG